MKHDLLRQAAALPVRQLHLAGAGLLLVIGAALWFYALRAPLAQLRTIRTEHTRLAQGGGDARLLSAQLAALGSDSAALARALGDAPTGPSAPLLVQLIGDVSTLAVRHRVALHGALPAPEQKAAGFEQFGIEADASGQYADLLAWIEAIEKARPNLGVDRFDLGTGTVPGQLNIKLRIAAYRPSGTTP